MEITEAYKKDPCGMQAMLEKAEIYKEKRKDGCWVREIPLESLTTLESIVCLSREKADDYVRISVHTKDLQTNSN